ncbi:MAG TPA: GMP/IMP nucleotidase [Gammaproteobacteria bacterium]|nr:GMP/IMP nucleotidase [Gammaproteobacteria bacterium]
MTSAAALDWSRIETVFLDMDGTLLDLNFDTTFWQSYIPACFAECNAMSVAEAVELLAPRFERHQGQLNWYCLDFWSRELGFDVGTLHREYQHEIGLLPNTAAFLERLAATGTRRVLLTNAHPVALAIKLERTAIGGHFDAIISSHQLGLPKEDPQFWVKLPELEPFVPAATLMVDDSLPVLRAARAAGIGQLRAICRPDSGQPRREAAEFVGIDSVAELFAA